MFYRPEEGHGLPRNPFSAIVAPRPIGWISTRGAPGDNLAPYSFFNAVAYEPPQVMFSSTSAKPDRGDTKDSVANIRESGVFCCNVVSEVLAEAMNRSSGPWEKGRDEFSDAALEKAECETIDCPRVARAPAALECRVSRILELDGASNFAVFGIVTGIHIDEAFLREGRLDYTAYRPVARLGYMDYAKVAEIFEMERPG